ncbi:Transglutaminase-like superfamily protein [Agromyces sp. CF514]|uniref:transglutaminaseTgpA domain-containing protein n=1 Tax=Agromyces sp. CF514 TaxID=1881031 RepID=UPI0008F2C2FD|nr:transglutaminaseTgpA domain-containing protein [Agromyces sp. CF514]SFR75262.1 Transglutaminase-like superfamily protein [Agromyces sp. CF514]
MNRIPRSAVTDLVVLSVLSVVAILGYETSFGDLDFLLAAAAGIVVGTAAAVLGSLFRLGVLTTAVLGLAMYFVLGTPFTMPDSAIFGVLPSLTSLAGLAIGAVYGWADILTIGTPVEAPYYVAVVPYVAGWAVALVGSMLVLRWLPRRRTVMRSAVLLIGPILLFVSGILLGTDEAFYAGVRGVAFAVIALVWLAWRRGSDVETDEAGARRLRAQKLRGSIVVVAGAVVIGAVAGLALAPVAPERFVLRDQVVPPFDPLEFSSPLAGFRNYTKDLAEEPLFTVTGLGPGDTLRLASMNSYTGRLWNVAGPGDSDDDGGYAITGETLPQPPLADLGSRRSIEVETLAYDDVWLPTVGYGSELRLEDAGSADRAGDLRYNAAAGTAVLTSGLADGARYRLDAKVQDTPSDEALADVPVAAIELPPIENVPDVVTAKGEEYVGDATTPIEQLRNIERGLKTNGFLSHGLASDAVASRAGHGADRLIELFTRSSMVGDEEQYAAAMALMVRQLGYPARVVMGFAPEIAQGQDSVDVLGGDVTAWVEVPFEGVGWISFDPTPDETDAPQEQTPKPQSEPQPQVRQPPRAEAVEDDLLSTVEIDDTDDEDKDRPFRVPGWVWAVSASIGIPLAIVFVPMLLVGLAKDRRRRRRRGRANEIAAAAAWDELIDRYAELGFEPPERSSRLQTARALEHQVAEQGVVPTSDPGALRLTSLAASVDRDVFDGQQVASDTVVKRWSEADAAAAAVSAAVGRSRRLIARYRLNRRR